MTGRSQLKRSVCLLRYFGAGQSLDGLLPFPGECQGKCHPSHQYIPGLEDTRRKVIVEPENGQIKEGRGLRRFLLRSLEKVNSEWHLIAATHNLL